MPSDAVARWWIVFALLFLLGAGLRVYHLGYRSLSTDEANVFWMARGSFDEIVLQNAIGNSAPPLYALALNPLAEAHASEGALRSLSCAAAIAALGALPALAFAYSGPTGALFALFLVALAPSQVFYAQFLREYSLAFLIAALLILAFTRFQRAPTWWNWSALGLLVLLGVFAQYGLALLLLALNVVFVVELRRVERRRERVTRWALIQVVALMAAWLVYDKTLRHQLHPGGFGVAYLAQGYWDGSLRSLLRLVVGNTFELFGFAHPAVPILQGLVLLGVIELWRTTDGRRAVLLLVTPILITIAAACLHLYPYLGARQSIAFTVMMYVCAASGFVLLRRLDWRAVGTALAVVWLGVEGLYGCYRTLNSTEPQHVRPVAARLTQLLRPDDRVYVYHRALTPLQYYAQEGPNWIHGVENPDEPVAYQDQIAEVLAVPGRVWLVFSFCQRNECDLILRRAAPLRHLERIAADTGTELYLADVTQ
jgi:hypothetical protein